MFEYKDSSNSDEVLVLRQALAVYGETVNQLHRTEQALTRACERISKLLPPDLTVHPDDIYRELING